MLVYQCVSTIPTPDPLRRPPLNRKPKPERAKEIAFKLAMVAKGTEPHEAMVPIGSLLAWLPVAAIKLLQAWVGSSKLH
jgi:hypothetical protein